MARKTKGKMFSITPSTMDKIDKLVNLSGAVSNSEVIRKAVDFFYDSKFPPYTRSKRPDVPSSEESRNLEGMAFIFSPEEVVKELDGVITKTKVDGKYGGEDVALFNGWFGGITIIPLSGIKEWYDKDKEAITQHLSVRSNEKGSYLIEDIFAAPASRQAYDKAGLLLPSIEEGTEMANNARKKRGLPPVPGSWLESWKKFEVVSK